MVDILIKAIHLISSLLIFILIADVFLSYFLPRDNRFRYSLDQIITPILDPIRRKIPVMGGFDFSPLILLIIIQVVESLLVNILVVFR